MSFRKQSADSYRFECTVHGERFSKTYKSFDEPYSSVKQKFYEWRVECSKGMYVNTNYSFAEFAEIWLSEYCTEYSPVVKKNYRCNLKNWILPKLGTYKLNNITPILLDHFVSFLKSSNNLADGQAKLSNGSIEKIWHITRAIITTAYTKNLISRNPCEKVSLGLRKSTEPMKPHCWDTISYRKAMGLLSRELSDNARVIEFAVKTGLRKSEILGLTWSDVDMQSMAISINKTFQKCDGQMQTLPCKTVSSVRDISISPSTVCMLAEYRRKHPDNLHVFENIDPDAVSKWFKDWQRRYNIPEIRFHDLRHTHASLLLLQGVDIKTISERLGHSNIGITMNTYTHVLRELDAKAAEVIDNI